VTFTLSSALTAETDGFVLNVPVPTGTYSGNIKVAATGGGLARAQIFNSRAISRAMGQKLAETLVIPLFGGPFTYEGEEYYISQGNMYKTATGYALYDDWTGGLNQYNVTAPGTQTWTGNSYFNWVHLAGLFDTSINTGANEPIDNDKTPIAGCYLPTNVQWTAFITETSRLGSSVNGTAGCRYALIQLTSYTNGSISNPVGVLLIPDGLTLTGMTKTFTWNTNSTSGNTGVTVAQLNEYLTKGCVFLPASGYYDGTWRQGGTEGYFWTASSTNGSTAPSRRSYTSSNLNKSQHYCPVRLIQE
jgi:hypothetical protein